MRAYRARKRAAGLRRVHEWAPDEMVYSDRRRLDARSLALHCMIARKIAREPKLLDIARRKLERWTERSTGHAPKYITQWQALLDEPWPQLAAFITSFSARAIRLRQSSPFAGVLDPRERKRIYAAFRA